MPNPHGSPGGPLHSGTITELSDLLEGLGRDVTREKKFDTPGGLKPYRRPDLLWEEPGLGQVAIQVYKPTKGGRIPLRELKAMQDLKLGGCSRVIFVPYE